MMTRWGRVVGVADTQLPTASARMSKSRLVQGGRHAYTAIVELNGPRRAGGVKGECVAAGQEGRVSGVEGTSWSRPGGARHTMQATRGGGWRTADVLHVGEWRGGRGGRGNREKGESRYGWG